MLSCKMYSLCCPPPPLLPHVYILLPIASPAFHCLPELKRDAASNPPLPRYLDEFQREDREAGDVKKECLRHLKRAAEVEAAIPSAVDIGLFHVCCEKLRRQLSKKCKDMSAALLNLLSAKLRSQADEICNNFRQMSNRLREKPSDIEALTDTREFMKSIPDSVRTYAMSCDASCVMTLRGREVFCQIMFKC